MASPILDFHGFYNRILPSVHQPHKCKLTTRLVTRTHPFTVEPFGCKSILTVFFSLALLDRGIIYRLLASILITMYKNENSASFIIPCLDRSYSLISIFCCHIFLFGFCNRLSLCYYNNKLSA